MICKTWMLWVWCGWLVWRLTMGKLLPFNVCTLCTLPSISSPCGCIQKNMDGWWIFISFVDVTSLLQCIACKTVRSKQLRCTFVLASMVSWTKCFAHFINYCTRKYLCGVTVERASPTAWKDLDHPGDTTRHRRRWPEHPLSLMISQCPTD